MINFNNKSINLSDFASPKAPKSLTDLSSKLSQKYNSGAIEPKSAIDGEPVTLKVKGFRLFQMSLWVNINQALPKSANKGLDSKISDFPLKDIQATLYADEPLPAVDELPNDAMLEQQQAQQNKRVDNTSNHILKFIELRLKQDSAEESTPEQLESRINAALEGFYKGYDEANRILADMNLLSPELEQEILMTKEKVMAGIETLSQDYLDKSSSELISYQQNANANSSDKDSTYTNGTGSSSEEQKPLV